MAIVMYVADGYGGYGDFIFGLKMLHGLQKSLQELGSNTPIYLVTQASGKDKIVALGGDTAFDVQVKSVEEFKHLQSTAEFTLEYFIEGPVFNPYTHQRITIPKDTPVLLISEYSLIPRVLRYTKELLENPVRWQLDLIQSGFNVDGGVSSDFFDKIGQGLFFNEELSHLAERPSDNFDYRVQYWAQLEGDSEKILTGQAIEDYHRNTDLFFEYSHDSAGKLGIYQKSHCKHYLQIHQIFTMRSGKNQDIVSVGNNTDAKKNALTALLPTLKADGYNRIVYIDLESGNETIFHDQPQLQQKVYRFLHTKKLTYKKMIAMLALSGDLVGATGDQSFGEAISGQKLIVYECLSHKKLFAEEYIKIFRSLDTHDKASQLVKLL